MKKIIGLDIDNTLTAVDGLQKLVEDYFGIDVPEECSYDYRFLNKILTKEQVRDFWKHNYFKYVKQSKPAEGLIELLNNYVYDEQDNEIHIITARPAFLRKETKLWLNKYNIKYDSLIMAGRKSKLIYINELSVNRMIDDNPELFIEFSNSNISNVELICIDQDYNKESIAHKRVSQITGLEII